MTDVFYSKRRWQSLYRHIGLERQLIQGNHGKSFLSNFTFIAMVLIITSLSAGPVRTRYLAYGRNDMTTFIPFYADLS